jgi:hypothetical protein
MCFFEIIKIIRVFTKREFMDSKIGVIFNSFYDSNLSSGL